MSRKNRRRQQQLQQDHQQDAICPDLVEVVSIDRAIELKMEELRAPSSHYIEPTKRANYNLLLRKASPEVLGRILDNLLNHAERDPRVGFAILQYLIGKPREMNLGPTVVMDELRALISARMVSKVPEESSDR
jgi:hypothetical protein